MKSKAQIETHAAESQSERFRAAARELGCDESEESFRAKLRKIARQKPKGGVPLTPVTKNRK
jgi:hypothetical protein